MVTAPELAIACSTGFVCRTVFSKNLQLRHHSAEKSTSTVRPSFTAICLSRSSEKGCQAMSVGAFAMRYNPPKEIAINTNTIVPAYAQDFRRSPNSAVCGVRAMSQQATAMPSNSASVGTIAIVSMNDRINTTVANSTKPLICLNVSIQAPGF